MLPPGLRRS